MSPKVTKTQDVLTRFGPGLPTLPPQPRVLVAVLTAEVDGVVAGEACPAVFPEQERWPAAFLHISASGFEVVVGGADGHGGLLTGKGGQAVGLLLGLPLAYDCSGSPGGRVDLLSI